MKTLEFKATFSKRGKSVLVQAFVDGYEISFFKKRLSGNFVEVYHDLLARELQRTGMRPTRISK